MRRGRSRPARSAPGARAWLGALGALLLAGCGPEPAAAPGLSAEAFTQALAATVRARHPQATLEVPAPLTLRVRLGEREGTLLLDNAHRAHRASGLDPAEASRAVLEALARQLRGEREGPPRPERLMAIVRDAGYVAELEAHARQAAAAPGQVPFHAPLAGDLCVLYAEDAEGHLAVLSPQRLAEAGLSQAGLERQAQENLRRLAARARLERVDGLWVVELDGTYEASLLLLEEFWTAERFPVAGDPVAAVPARGLLLVGGSGDAAGLERLRALARRGVEELDHPISATLLRRRAGRWHPLP